MRFTFVHASDLHLDTPFSGLGRVDSQLPEIMQDATLTAWRRLVDLTIEQRASFLLLAGDIFDGPERGVRAQLAFRDGLQRLSDAGIDTFVTYGNHDPLDGPGWQAIKSWPARVTIFGSNHVESVAVERDGDLLATVHGISYASRETHENLALRFRRPATGGVHIGVLHASVGDQPEHTPYSPCSLDDLRRSGLDYWALGHIHTRQILHEGSPWVAYPGNLQGLSMKPSERQAKGALIVDVDGGRIRAPRFAPLAPIQFDQIAIDIKTTTDIADIVTHARQQADELRQSATSNGLVLRVMLTGRGDVYNDLLRSGTTEDLLTDLRQQAHDGIWWEAIRNHTRPALDRSALRSGQSLAAEVIKEAERLQHDPTAMATLRERIRSISARIPGAGPLEPAWDDAVLDDALEMALDLLVSGANA